MIGELYPAALDCGLASETFWKMSLGEIHDYMESYGRREKARMKQEVSEKHFLAKDIAQYVGVILNGSKDNTLLELWDFFPGLFGEEKIQVEKETQIRQMAVYKAQMKDFVFSHNSQKGRGE